MPLWRGNFLLDSRLALLNMSLFSEWLKLFMVQSLKVLWTIAIDSACFKYSLEQSVATLTRWELTNVYIFTQMFGSVKYICVG